VAKAHADVPHLAASSCGGVILAAAVAKKEAPVTLEVGGREVRISSPSKPYFPEAGITKLDLVRYYESVADGAVRGIYDRPFVLKRFVDGIAGESFFQKRAPKSRPDWIRVVELRFPSGRTAEEVVITEPAQLLWCINLGNIDLNPHPVRSDDLDHPDELRVDLDPGPGTSWAQVQRVAMVVKEVLEAHQLVGWPKTSGSRGIHVNVRIERRWGFPEVRRAALALAREVERRIPADATSSWWKEERHGVFLDYNQNAKDRTVASAYSVRPVPDARVSAPLTWDEVPACELADFTLKTMPARVRERGDLHEAMDRHAGSLDMLLEVSARHEADGDGDAPWPPHYQKQADEPARVQPSRKKTSTTKTKGQRTPKFPLLTIATAKHKQDALDGLTRWKERHAVAAAHLSVEDVLVDAMRGRSSMWWRVRVNLRHVPEDERPEKEPPDPDYDPWAGMR
jgi:DNA ligase D-like protein (predicted polymerase)